MHPLKELECDAVLENPLLQTPPPEPQKPRSPRVRKPRVFNLAPRFSLLTEDFYMKWCNHQKELQMASPIVEDAPPGLFPELYLKPRRLNYYAKQIEENMKVNKELLKRINLIQRTGGFVDCWRKTGMTDNYNKLLCDQRQRKLDEINKKNMFFYSRLQKARSEQPLTSELEHAWKETKHKLILGAQHPFILFKTEKIDRGIKDPNMEAPPKVRRPRVSLEIWVDGGAKLGKVKIELFTDIAPATCQLFMNLLQGDERGHAYAGTRIFRIVPTLYCRAGDVTKDNGFGTYLPEGETEPLNPENFDLKHTVPGVLSMAVTSDNEVYGHFNIIFKPLPQLDNKNVVFGRIIAGPTETLERISATGRPLGTTIDDVVLRKCGWYSRKGRSVEGPTNTVLRREVKKKSRK